MILTTQTSRRETLNTYRQSVLDDGDFGGGRGRRHVEIPVTGDVLGVDDEETESTSAETAIDYKGKFTVDVPADF